MIRECVAHTIIYESSIYLFFTGGIVALPSHFCVQNFVIDVCRAGFCQMQKYICIDDIPSNLQNMLEELLQCFSLTCRNQSVPMCV